MKLDSYFETWSDLPASTAVSYAPRKWRRGRTWGQGEWRYVRPAAIPIAVSVATHETLRRLTSCVAELEHEFCRVLQAAFDARQIGLIDEKPVWDKNMGKRWLNDLALRMARAGVVRGSLQWHARERCCARLFSSSRNRVLAGRRPELDWADGEYPADHDWSAECPPGLNVRIAAGAAHRRPVIEQGAGWMAIEGLGLVWSPEKLEAGLRPSEAAYVECAHFDQRWHARFVFAGVHAARRSGHEGATAENFDDEAPA